MTFNIGKSGASGRSRALGASDPRARRGAQAALIEGNRLGGGLKIDSRQRLTVTKAAVPSGTGDSLILDLVAKLQAAGLMEAN